MKKKHLEQKIACVKENCFLIIWSQITYYPIFWFYYISYRENDSENDCCVTVAQNKEEEGDGKADKQHNVNPKGDEHPRVGVGDGHQSAVKHEGNQSAQRQIGQPADQENYLNSEI